MRDQGLSPKELTTYILGALLAILLATTGTVYGLTNNRISKVEEAVSARAQSDQTTAVQLAVLQTSLGELQKGLTKLDDNQARLVTKMDSLVDTMIKDSRRWNAQMDTFDKERRDAKK